VEATPVEAAPVEAAPVEAAPVEAAPVEAAPVEAASVDASAAAKAPATDPLESDELLARKKQLAADLHYLVYAGHVIEFADGKLDLPIVPLPASQGKGKPTGNDTSAHEDESGSSLDPEDHNVEEFNEPQTSTDPQQTDEAIESEDHGQTSIEASSPGAPSES
jgi:hypothetical protein